MGIPFLKAQAWHEAGKQYPAAEEDWANAKKRVLSGVPTANTVKKAALSLASGTASGAVAGMQAGLSLPVWYPASLQKGRSALISSGRFRKANF